MTVASDDKAILGEGPIWDTREGRLFWVDIVGGAINVLTPGAPHAQRIELGEHVGCIALTAHTDTLVAAVRSGWYWVDVETGAKQLIAASPAPEGCRFNDGAVDRGGRLWVGTLEDGETRPAGELFLLDPDLTYRAMDGGFLCSNGITWSADRQWLFFVDSRNNAIFRYGFDEESGAIGDRELFIDTTDFRGIPDGIEMDSEDTLWCAFWDGAQVVGFDTRGDARATIPVPALRPTSITFGGPELATLYVTSARFGLSETDLAAWPASGCVFELDVTTPGLPANVFGAEPWTEPH
ncbi:MAG TPA: SMP-30/gluconolactonase/LRE family protein [Gaiellaceae bacterium]|nr:SMP-30/gluconolactonase/LRE family protein [Gaiellaceae bacterium]